MSNPNEPKSYGREVRQESYNDANGHTHVTRTSETVNNVSNPNAYRDGYVEGRVTENHYQEEVLAERDNENAGRGLLIGILLTSLAALTAGAIWYYNQRNDVPPTIVIPNSQPAPSPSPEAKRETTIIEKTRDVPVPVVVPQQAPAPQAPAPAPDINISVPNSVTQPPAQEAPATQSAPSQSESQSNSTSDQSSSTDTQDTQSSTDITTPSAGTSSQSDTTSGSTSTGGGTSGSAQ